MACNSASQRAPPFDSDAAVTLDGSTGYVKLPKISNDFTSGFSAEVWAYPTSVGSNARFVDLGNGTSDDIVLYRVGTSSNLAFIVYQGGNQGAAVVANNAITLNQWQYFAVTMDAKGNVTLYKNGVAIATGTTYVPRTGIARTTNYLGQSNFGGAALFAGSLDEAAIYAAPLTAAQITAHYAPGVLRHGQYRPATKRRHCAKHRHRGARQLQLQFGRFPPTCRLAPVIRSASPRTAVPNPSGLSSQSFQIAGSSTDYYVAVNGSDSNTGTDPADAMASLTALLTAYPTLGSGDTVHVGPGTYTLVGAVTVGAGHSGLTITGPTSAPQAIFVRGNSGSDVIDVSAQRT